MVGENQVPREYYQSLPKVELHRHLEGSIRLRTLVEIGRSIGMDIPGTGKLRELVQVRPEEKFTFQNFLSKFQNLRMFYRSPEIIERITRETIADAAADNIRHMELRFTPVALSRAEGFPLGEVMDWVAQAAQQAEKDYGVKIRLIASVNRQEQMELAQEVAQLAAERRHKGIIGLDLAGDEANFSGMPFLSLFKEAKEAGLYITIHAGEWSGAQNVLEAIQYLHADRIAHGVRVLENPVVTAIARERGIPFEVCVTSNYQSGVVADLSIHPLPRMISLGLNATINTDDPSISQITLSQEYQLACEDLKFNRSQLHDRILAAAKAAFLPIVEKDNLVKSIEIDLPPLH